MNRYTCILNSLKLNISHIQLTPSQMACRACIKERLFYPGVVNLYGPSGVGKTLMGWVLANSGFATYLVHPTKHEQIDLCTVNIVFVDNARSDRISFRQLMGTLESRGVERIIVVTRSPADDYVFRTELSLSNEDIAIAQRNLADMGYQIRIQNYMNLWQLLRKTAGEEQ